MYDGCSIVSALECGLLDAYVPEEVRQNPTEAVDYQPNEFLEWAVCDDNHKESRGVIYTKYCSRKRVRTWQHNKSYNAYGLLYLVECNRALRYRNPRVKYVVVPMFKKLEEEKVEVHLGNKKSYWPRSKVEIALEQGGSLMCKGTLCTTIQQYEAYVKHYKERGLL